MRSEDIRDWIKTFNQYFRSWKDEILFYTEDLFYSYLFEKSAIIFINNFHSNVIIMNKDISQITGSSQFDWEENKQQDRFYISHPGENKRIDEEDEVEENSDSSDSWDNDNIQKQVIFYSKVL